MGAGFGFRVDRHDRAWRFLQSLSFDFALLQETVVPSWAGEIWNSDRIAYVPRRTGALWGTAVLSGGSSIQTFEPPADRYPWSNELQGASLITHTSDEKIWLVSLHSNAQPVPSELLLRHQHDHVRCRHDGVGRSNSLPVNYKKYWLKSPSLQVGISIRVSCLTRSTAAAGTIGKRSRTLLRRALLTLAYLQTSNKRSFDPGVAATNSTTCSLTAKRRRLCVLGV